MRRAGLDYHDFTRVTLHDSLAACEQQLHTNRWFAMTTKGSRNFAEVAFNAQDVLLFGPETRGLPDELLARWPGDRKLRIPMQASSRSINLANSVAITLYEAWRQRGYDGIL
jgi:tRNA (cytidine/uridine-2'-O-)-methyltransferase